MKNNTNNPICHYCEEVSVLVSGKEIYPHRPDLYSKQFYQCAPCDAFVGCHLNSTKPLGRLANKELRQAKMNAHSVFDPLWKTGEMKRSEAYLLLSKLLNIPVSQCHIGMFDVEMCNKAITALQSIKPHTTRASVILSM